MEAGLEEAACCPRRGAVAAPLPGRWARTGRGRNSGGRGNAEGRRERVKAHVGFERGFRRSPGGSSSRMFV